MTATDTDVNQTLDHIKGGAVGTSGAAGISPMAGNLLGVLRLAMGWIFAWALLDKLFGLGFDTCRNPETGAIDTMCDAAVLQGGSPTWGFLNFGTQGSKTADLVTWLATDAPNSFGFGDALYLLALLILAVTFTSGIALRLGAITGVLLMGGIYLAAYVWPQFNPFVNENVIYAIVMVVLASLGAGRWLGAGNWWARQPLSSRSPLLR